MQNAKTKETESEELYDEEIVEKDKDSIDIVPIKSTPLSKMALSASKD